MLPMNRDEKFVLQSYLNVSRYYLEYGAGDTTLQAVNTANLAEICSVENNQSDINQYLLSHSNVQTAMRQTRLLFHYVAIGETAAPDNLTNKAKHLWPLYPLSILTQRNYYDFVVINGQFKIACALNGLLQARSDCIFMLRGFDAKPDYQQLIPFIDVIEQVNGSIVYQRKPAMDEAKAQTLLMKYQYLPCDTDASDSLMDKLRHLVHGLQRSMTTTSGLS